MSVVLAENLFLSWKIFNDKWLSDYHLSAVYRVTEVQKCMDILLTIAHRANRNVWTCDQRPLVYAKKKAANNINESLFWQFHFAWFLRIYGGKVKKCKHRKAVKYREEMKKKKNKVPYAYFVDFVTTEAMSFRFAHWSRLQAHCFLAFPLKVTKT